MRCLPFLLLLACVGTPKPPPEAASSEANSANSYPDGLRGEQVDTYHGVSVPDPYRWLEDPDSEPTRAWIDAENQLTRATLDAVPERSQIRDRVAELWKRERWSVPMVRGGRTLYRYNDGSMNQSVLMMAEQPGAPGKRILDPNTFSEDGTTSLSETRVSPDGKHLAYSISEGGSDWRTYKVLDLESGEPTEDVLKWAKFSRAAWKADGSGFFYSRYPEPEGKTEANHFQKIYFHALSTPQSADVLVYDNPEQPDWGFTPQVTDDGRWLVIHIGVGTEEKSRIHLIDLEDPKSDPVKILDDFDADYRFITSREHRFYFFTTKDAPKGRVVSIDVRKDGPEAWSEIVGEGEDVIESTAIIGDRLVVGTLHDASARLHIFDLSGELQGEVSLPGIGSIWGLSSRPEGDTGWFGFESFTRPPTVFSLDLSDRSTEPVWELELSFDPEDYTTEQVFTESADGTRVPIFLTYAKGERPSGAPTLLYGYGGFNISITPKFKVRNLVWIERGGVYASATLRGGGEYGEQWHQAGTKTHKQNVFDDFIAAGEWLRDSGVSSGTAIHGRSNGGLLAGATVLQRPDLFAAALPSVGVLDMLKFEKWTIGWAWSSDYGTVADPEQFKALHAYSPVHNAVPAEYPPVLISTADHDDRVVPAHSFKFAAALQHAQQGPAPILIRIETQAGHGAGKSQAMGIDEATDELAFMTMALESKQSP